MTLNALLNSDMATISRTLRGGWDWWREELANMLPQRRRLGWKQPRRRTVLFADAQGLALVENGDVRLLGGEAVASGLPLLLPPDSCLVRMLDLPNVGRRDLSRLLAIDGERYFPMPAGTALFAIGPINARGANGGIRAPVAALSAQEAQRAAALATQVSACAVLLADAEMQPDPRFDFMPALRAQKLVPDSRGRLRSWWLIVGFLFVINLAMIGWRDSAAVDRLQEMVDAQRPAASVAQRIVQRMRTADRLARQAATRRASHDAIGILADVTRAVPDGAWVQRFAMEGASVRLTGYRLPDADVAGALRRVPRFASIKNAQNDEVVEIASGQPFDLVAELRDH